MGFGVAHPGADHCVTDLPCLAGAAQGIDRDVELGGGGVLGEELWQASELSE